MAKDDVTAKKMTGGNYPSKGGFKENKLPGATQANMKFKPTGNKVDKSK